MPWRSASSAASPNLARSSRPATRARSALAQGNLGGAEHAVFAGAHDADDFLARTVLAQRQAHGVTQPDRRQPIAVDGAGRHGRGIEAFVVDHHAAGRHGQHRVHAFVGAGVVLLVLARLVLRGLERGQAVGDRAVGAVDGHLVEKGRAHARAQQLYARVPIPAIDDTVVQELGNGIRVSMQRGVHGGDPGGAIEIRRDMP
ncbi:Uncharacterised protein [Bordetella pertussis]|nr:Uncharacterised protein [Bordetella pertussis]